MWEVDMFVWVVANVRARGQTVQQNLGEQTQKKTRWLMNVKYLKEIEKDIKDIWEEFSSEAPFFAKIRKVIRFYRQYCLHKTKESKKKETELMKSWS